MTMNEWQRNWVNTVVECGISQSTALETYKAMYREGPDLNKNPVQEALAMLEKITA